MRRYLLIILLFFCIVGVLDLIYGNTFDYINFHTKGGMSKEITDLCMNDQHDIIIMGSSRAHHHYVPSLFEQTFNLDCYNAGVNGNGIILMDGFLNLIIERYHPKLIIYDIENSFDINIYEPDNNRLRYIKPLKPFYNNDYISNLIKTISMNDFYEIHSGFYRYNSMTFILLREYAIGGTVYKKGYRPLYGKLSTENYEYMPCAPVDSVKYSFFCRFIETVKKNDINLIIVASPKYKNTHYSELVPLFELCRVNNIPYLDYYNDKFFLQHRELFADRMHLNDDGANIFTSMLINDIIENNFFN